MQYQTLPDQATEPDDVIVIPAAVTALADRTAAVTAEAVITPASADDYTPQDGGELAGYLGSIVTHAAADHPDDPHLARGAAAYRRWYDALFAGGTR